MSGNEAAGGSLERLGVAQLIRDARVWGAEHMFLVPDRDGPLGATIEAVSAQDLQDKYLLTLGTRALRILKLGNPEAKLPMAFVELVMLVWGALDLAPGDNRAPISWELVKLGLEALLDALTVEVVLPV